MPDYNQLQKILLSEQHLLEANQTDLLQKQPRTQRLCGPELGTLSSDADRDLTAQGMDAKPLGLVEAEQLRMSEAMTRTADSLQVPLSPDPTYQGWLLRHYPNPARLTQLSKAQQSFAYRPLISLLLPVFEPSVSYLRATVASVLTQVYPDWELCMVNACLGQAQVQKILDGYLSSDPRIKAADQQRSAGLSDGLNTALGLATGDFIAVINQGDKIAPDALYEVVGLINQHRDTDMVYSDEDTLQANGQLSIPYFKPDWSPESLLSRFYTGNLGVYRHSILEEIGGFRTEYEGSHVYDFVLRFTEKTSRVRHIAKALYHCRRLEPAGEGSLEQADTLAREISKPPGPKPAVSRKVLEDALERRQQQGSVVDVPGAVNHYIVRYQIATEDLISIIIPTRDLGPVLDKCLDSISNKTTYKNYEVLLIDNGSTERDAIEIINKWEDTFSGRLKNFVLDIPFNYSKLNNFATTKAQGQYFVFLNNDTEVITHDWLKAMVEYAQQNGIGAVGPKLLYLDNTIQHAGVIGGLGGVVAGHGHRLLPKDSAGYFNQLNTLNNYSALTGACLMVKASIYQEVGGLEEALAVAFNDVDFCFKLIQKGYRNVYLPHVSLYHHESKSRGIEDTVEKLARVKHEIEYMQKKWPHFIENDPYYSKHLSRFAHQSFSIR
ncbi:MAG: glycosyltransferase family 2 protein [Cyanobacteria bacterium P01_G01_bin.38]